VPVPCAGSERDFEILNSQRNGNGGAAGSCDLSQAPGTTLNEISLRTGVWYGDQFVALRFPDTWDLSVLWPKTPPALSDSQIAQPLEHPVGQAPIRELCRGKSSPLVIVDDPNRPTPVARVLPFLLKPFCEAGIDPRSIRILIATGTHAAPRRETVQKKIGPEAFATCQVLVHDAYRNLAKLGRTSLGTPVEVNREVLRSDLVIGMGGIYPNHTAGYGGGSKLALGVLGFRSIRHLHYGHTAAGRRAAFARTSMKSVS
jgi:lactate racemase